MDKMKVAVMEGIGKMGFVQRDIPAPQKGEALVKLEYIGICGSDLHYYEKGAIGNYVVKPPFVLGHECGGVVAALGESVTHLAVGDKVALEPGKTCGYCEFCKAGKYNLCKDVIFFATPPVDGVFCEYVAHEAALCFKLPENMSTLEGALIEPLAVGFHAAAQGGAAAGQTAAVMGCGCIGIMCMLALKAKGVKSVFMADVLDTRLEKAKALGASAVINSARQGAAEAILELTDGAGVDLVIEASGAQSSFKASVEAAKRGGTVVFVAYPANGEATLPISLALDKELGMQTVFRYRGIYPPAIEAVASGAIDLKGVVTNEFTLDDIQEAMDQSLRRKNDIVKAVVRVV